MTTICTADERFVGRIAGVGTAAKTRIVMGLWAESPLGRFADVMIETEVGHRLLLAPGDDVAEYVSSTYTFDEVRVVPVSWRKVDGGLEVVAGRAGEEPLLHARLGVGRITWLGALLRAVPSAFATRPGWLGLVDPIARILVPGAATAGTAGRGRREYYGVTLARRITSLEATFEGQDLGALARLSPPVRFGFGSAPATPALVDVTTTIRAARP
ncbi:hypothetical protein AX769_20110 [Frondihabitans sp. PAMC 28766]|uniref:hypothetical protein n=1 Tax=Frondihabitans sp. PAMC 28766 TaxID=1795630 RepID=UPI00078B6FF6|nr:hypothetical protein [Frondihabitans sp. PAMC 28766]AMM22030.1 hypothetical protein AX769_20110 [Frondihabitans sp. PAMC 28766]